MCSEKIKKWDRDSLGVFWSVKHETCDDWWKAKQRVIEKVILIGRPKIKVNVK